MRSATTRWLCRLAIFLVFAVGNNPFKMSNEDNDSSITSLQMDQPAKPLVEERDGQQQSSAIRHGKQGRPIEFVHIPKTGGSSIEYVGALHGITWGKCHYDVSIEGAPCPDRNRYRQYLREYLPATKREDQWAPFWHVPPKFFRKVKNEELLPTGGINPYPANVPMFAVVRNPYSRLVSEWYFINQVQLKSGPEHYNDVKKFNLFLTKRLRQLVKFQIWKAQKNMRVASNPYWMHNAHFVPQSDFIYNDYGKQIVQHVLKFETMKADFDALMEKYGWSDLKLNEEHSNVSKNKRLSVPHISDKNFKMINRLYKKDFENFGYHMHVPGPI